MAELAGSIIGIVSAGTKVALVLSQLSADIGSAGQEARMISGEIRAFCTVLRTLGETLEKIGASRHYAHCSEMITDMTAASLDLFTEILDAIQSLKNMTAGKDGKDGNFGFVTRVHWAVFKKPRVLVLRAAMESYKSNLALMLGTLDTAEKVARRTSLTNSPNNAAQNERDRSLLESLERDRAASLIDLAQAERQYAESLDPRIADSSIDIIDSTPTSGQTSHDAAAVIADPESDNLEYAARNEIHSIRLSFSRASVFGNDAIHATIIRHSQRISRMFESDENRLSPRWSLMIQEDWGTTLDNRSQKSPLLVIDQLVDIATRRLEVNVAAAGKLDAGGHIAPEFEPRIVDSYMSFLSWLLELEASQQQLVFSALKLDFTEGTALLVQGESPRAAHIDDASLTPRGESASPDNTTAATKIQQVLDLVQKQMNFQRRSTSVDNQDKQEQVVRHATAQTVGGATVDLGAQNITEFPEEAVGIMGSELARLALSQNNLSTLPDSIVNCGHLRYLNLRLNNFKTIPDVVMRLPLLEILDMSRNMLHSLPPKLFGMSKLKVLAVAKNRIRTLPVSIGDAPSLIVLHVEGNPIEYPNSDQIDYRFPKWDDGGQESMTWTTNLKVTLKELHRAALNQADQFF